MKEKLNRVRSFFGFKKNERKDEIYRKKAQWELFTSKAKGAMFIILIIAEIGFFYYMAKMYGLIDEVSEAGSKIAVIDFNKPVTQEYVNTIIGKMETAKKEDEYKEVLFIMSSPGGSPTASEELSEYLKDFNKDKNVTMYIQSVAASGGYYIASAIKPLLSNRNAMVGSIGMYV